METNELIAILRYCASNGCIRDGVDEPCKFGIENETSDCVSPLLTEAADRIAATVDAIAIEPLAEWLAGYAAPPKYAIDAVGGLREMSDATKRAKAWEFALTSMERSGFLEVRVE